MRLIDADALKDKCYITVNGTTIGRNNYVMFHEIDDAPTIDAVEVVRCKDCIHYESDESVCRIDDMIVDDTDYCSYGEKSNKTNIDVGQLSFSTPITMTESLTDVSPMEWSKDVLNGEKKVEVKADNKDCAVGERSE